MQIFYTLKAVEIIKHLHPGIKSLIREKIEELKSAPYSGKPLQDELEGFRSLRYKTFRVIYSFDESKKIITVIFAGKRQQVYQLFMDYLKKQHSS